MHYRVGTSPYRRALFPAAAVLAWVLILVVIFTVLKGMWLADLALMAVLLVWITPFGVRGWRAPMLTATATGVRFRGLVWTRSWRWQLIDGFVAETRPVHWRWLPVRVPRRVLGIRLRAGRTTWLPELNCRPGQDGRSWVDAAAAQLNDLAQLHTSRPGQAENMP